MRSPPPHSLRRNMVSIALIAFVTTQGASFAVAQDLPRVLVHGLAIQRIASDLQIVTPVSCTCDRHGDLYAIESHTHFRPDDYKGPATDRVWRYRDSAGPRNTLERTLFCDTTTHTMQVCPGPDDWIYISTRNQVLRLHANRSAADPLEASDVVLRLKTVADYPHNGLSGLALGPDGWLYVGLGENFGEPYVLEDKSGVGIQGGGEGGNIFRCRPDGTELQRLATGLWNPFALCFDTAGRLWTVDNDPDASPPCRLLHVVPGADYGFQFRFGRAGTNPLQSWNGQFPGTLGFAAGTGEAPSGIVCHRGYLWVTSWGDNRIERYQLTPSGASVQGEREVVVQGGTGFRPVGLTVGSQGSLYLTDWVDRSYTLHGKGALWRIDFSSSAASASGPPRSPPEIAAASISQFDPLWTSKQTRTTVPETDAGIKLQRSAGLSDADPFVRTAAIWGLIRTKSIPPFEPNASEPALARVSLLQAHRWLDLDRSGAVAPQQRQVMCQIALQDRSQPVRLTALRWIAEARDQSLRSDVEKLLQQPSISSQECRVVLATLDFLDLEAGEGAYASGQHSAAAIVNDKSKSPTIRSLALSLLTTDAPTLSIELLTELAQEKGDLAREATRALSLNSNPSRFPPLVAIAQDTKLDGQQRADAVMGLAADAAGQRTILADLSTDTNGAVRTEAQRILKRLNKDPLATNRPSATDIPAWIQLTSERGDSDAGWRVFFRATSGQCSTCHAYQHRGSDVGPDLSTLAGTQTQRRILESILQPSREIGPLYVPWRIVTTDGRVLEGTKLNAGGVDDQVRYLSNTGETFDLALNAIEEQSMTTQSVMPTGLCDLLEDSELRDLLALLTTPSQAPADELSLGVTLTSQDSGVEVSLRGLSVLDEGLAWASGSNGTVLRTVDGGHHWEDVSITAAKEVDFRDIEGLSQNCAVAMGVGSPGRIYRTEDGGATWTRVYEDTRPSIFLDAMAFWDENEGLAVGDPIDGHFVVLRTQDGGRSWIEITQASAIKAGTDEAAFAASGTSLALGPNRKAWLGVGGITASGHARIFTSSDGGNSWGAHESPLASSKTSGIFSLLFFNVQQGIAVGGDYANPTNATQNLAVTGDGGETWSCPNESGPRGYRSCVACCHLEGKPLLVCAGTSGLDISCDCGAHWSPAGNSDFNAIAFPPMGSSGWAVGSQGRIARIEIQEMK